MYFTLVGVYCCYALIQSSWQVEALPGCRENTDCEDHEICISEQCGDLRPLCDDTEQCGPHANCSTTNHALSCVCKPGYLADQYGDCVADTPKKCVINSDCRRDQVCRSRKCVDICGAVCGKNAICNLDDSRPTCSCGPGFEGNPFFLCEKTKTCRGSDTIFSFHREDMKIHQDASLFCSQKGMRLVSITNAEKQLEVKNCLAGHIPAGRSFWVSTAGVYDSSSKVIWSTGEKEGTYSNFQNGLNLTNNWCVDLKQEHDYRWGTYNCNVKQAFLCEKSLKEM